MTTEAIPYSLKPWAPYFKSLSPYVQKRITCERQVARALSREAIRRGYFVWVHDGEEFSLRRSQNLRDIFNALHATDEDHLIIATKGGRRIGTFILIYGNCGYDVISNYSWVENDRENTSEIMHAIDAIGQAVADRWEPILDRAA